MAPSNFTPNERLLRKRLAARLRQRRCRERKREMIMAGIVGPRTGSVVTTTNKIDSNASIEGTASGDNSTVYSSTKSTPASSPSKSEPTYVNIQNARPPPQGGYSWTYPVMPPIPRNRTSVPSTYHHGHPPPSAPNGYYPPPSNHYHQAPIVHVMYPHHPHHQYMPHPPGPHYYPPQKGNGNPYSHSVYGPPPPIYPPTGPHSTEKTNVPYRPTVESDPGDVSRTVSRSPSDASMHSGKAAEIAAEKDKVDKVSVVKVEETQEAKSVTSLSHATGVVSADEMGVAVTAKKKNKSKQKSLMSTEKAAISAMLAMKSSSDESDGDSISTGTNKSLSVPQEEILHSKVSQKQQHALVASV